jgi:ferredoxin--NADP+ reductase
MSIDTHYEVARNVPNHRIVRRAIVIGRAMPPSRHDFARGRPIDIDPRRTSLVEARPCVTSCAESTHGVPPGTRRTDLIGANRQERRQTVRAARGVQEYAAATSQPRPTTAFEADSMTGSASGHDVYNATVERIVRAHDELMILRVRPDAPAEPFEPGQYTTLGLGYWEPRIPGAQPETLDERQRNTLCKRAYSIGCPMLDKEDRVVRTADIDFLEFYVTLVRWADHPPGLTPRLFALAEGARIFLGPRAHGHYTLAEIGPDDDVLFAATGTGEAPHNAMLAELLGRGHRGRIAMATCARYRQDLAYLETHRRLERLFPPYRYLPLTTREPENTDPSAPGYVGKQYLQSYFASGGLEAALGWPLDPQRAHVFLCGSPAMIGAPRIMHGDEPVYPEPAGMVEVLMQRGFRLGAAAAHPARSTVDAGASADRANIHFEKFW